MHPCSILRECPGGRLPIMMSLTNGGLEWLCHQMWPPLMATLQLQQR